MTKRRLQQKQKLPQGFNLLRKLDIEQIFINNSKLLELFLSILFTGFLYSNYIQFMPIFEKSRASQILPSEVAKCQECRTTRKNLELNNQLVQVSNFMDKSMELQNNQTFRRQKEMESPFIKKVKKIMEDPENIEVIRWNSERTAIEIRNQKIFEQKILSRHFRHSRISSFVRQLNLYGFKKIRSTENRIFTHSLLQKGLGLDSIMTKKIKVSKNVETDHINGQFRQEHVLNKNDVKYDRSCSKEIGSVFGISQNFIAGKEDQIQEKNIISTNNVISIPENNMNTVWFLPFPTMQQQVVKMPFSIIQENLQVGMGFNFYSTWC